MSRVPAIPQHRGEESSLSLFGVAGKVYVISLVRFCDALGNSFLFVTLPLYFVQFYEPSMQFPEEVLIGFLLALYGIVAAVMQPVVGWLSDRLGRRKVFVVAGLCLLTAATYGFTLASSFAHLALLRCLQGLGIALNVPTSFAMISAYSKRSNRATSMGVYTTARHLGFGIGPPLAGALYLSLGFHGTFLFATGLILLGTVLFTLFVAEVPRVATGWRRSAVKVGIVALLTRGGLAALGIVSILTAITIVMLFPLEKEIILRLAMSPADFGFAVSALLLGRLLFQLPMGKLADRAGRKPVMKIGLLLLCPAVAAVGLSMSIFVLFISLAFVGLALAGIGPASFALAADMAPAGGEARQLSILTTAFGIGMAGAPLITGLLAGYFFFELPFLVVSTMALAVWAIVALAVSEPESPQEAAL